MIDSLASQKLTDGVSGAGQQLAQSKGDAMVNVPDTVWNLVPNVMPVDWVCVSPLTALITVMTYVLVFAVLACHWAIRTVFMRIMSEGCRGHRKRRFPKISNI